MKNIFSKLQKTILPYFLRGILTGAITGLIVFAFNFLAEHVMEWSANIYGFARQNPAYIPLIIIGAAAIALLIGYTIKLVPEIRGGGIPYIEGITRGKFTLRWFIALPAMFIAALLSLFTGLSVGSEGPSVFIGGATGYGVAHIGKNRWQEHRILTTAGASAGLSAAFAAPLSGVVFALEEAHRRFSAQILVPVISSVLSASLVITLLGGEPFLDFSALNANSGWQNLAGACLIGLSCGLLGIIFSATLTARNPLLEKIPIQFRVLIPAAAAVLAGLFLPAVIGGGKHILSDIADYAAFGLISVLTLLVAKTALTLLSARSKASGGLFIPMLAIGALCGAAMSLALSYIGLKTDLVFMAMIGAAALFASAVRAPLTAIVLMFEITRFSLAGMLCTIAAVGVAYLLGELVKARPLYEKQLTQILASKNLTETVEATTEISLTVSANTYGADMCIRDLVLPDNVVITSVTRGEYTFVPDGETTLRAGDFLKAACELHNKERAVRELTRMFNFLEGEP